MYNLSGSVCGIVATVVFTAAAFQTENVFIAVIDGARYTETFGDESHQYIPQIWNDLKPLSTIYTNFYIEHEGETYTNAGHMTIVTGTWQHTENTDAAPRADVPTIFEYFLKSTGATSENACLVLGKDKLDILSYSNHADYGSAYGALVTPPDYYNDANTYTHLTDAIAANHPKLVLINFPQVDGKGHSGVWNDYPSAIQNVDNLMKSLWDLIQSDDVYKDKTTLIITNDHGRHDDAHGGFSGHGCDCEGCEHLMLLVAGPDTPDDTIDAECYRHIDIAPTVGRLMGFETSLAAGSAILSAAPDVVYALRHDLTGETTYRIVSVADAAAYCDVLGRRAGLLRSLAAPSGYSTTRKLATGMYSTDIKTAGSGTVSQASLKLK